MIIVVQRIGFILILMAVGALAGKLRIITDKVQKSLSALILDICWPCLILSSFIKDLTRTDVLSNWLLPVLALVMVLTGFLLALLVTKIKHYTGDAKKIFLYHGAVNNFVFMVLPFVEILVPGKGPGLLFIHNLGIILAIWTLGVLIFKPGLKSVEIAKNLLSPGLIATVGGILLVVSGLSTLIPGFIKESLAALGAPAMTVSLMVIGAQIFGMGKDAIRFDAWNRWVVIIRLLLVPAVLFIVALVLKAFTPVSRDVLMIFMLVNLMPVSLNSVSMAYRFGSDPDLAARGVVLTHLFSVVTITLFLPVIEYFL